MKKQVSIVAPSGNVLDVTAIERVEEMFVSRGWQVSVGNSVSQSHQRFAGADEAQRLADFNQAASEAELILTARGGYGLNRIVDGIDFATLKKRGVWVAGFSDVTLLSLAILSKIGGKSIQSPTASILGKAQIPPETTESFFNLLSASEPYKISFPSSASDFNTSGMLWGGNLSMLASAVGTPWFPSVENGILFIEDVAEPAYKVERCLMQLADAGVLSRQKAVLVGCFSNMRHSDHDFGYGLEDALQFVREKTKVPFIDGLPFGHVDHSCSLVVGSNAELTVSAGHAELVLLDTPNLEVAK